MQKARRYQSGRLSEVGTRSFGNGVFFALIVSAILLIVLLFAVSLAEWLIPDLFGEYGVYVASVIPIISMGIGAYVGSRRLLQKAVWLGGVNGLTCWLTGLCIAWCSGIDITAFWISVSAGICLSASLIGALLGVLRIK